jgi:hypothetical protein
MDTGKCDNTGRECDRGKNNDTRECDMTQTMRRKCENRHRKKSYITLIPQKIQNANDFAGFIDEHVLGLVRRRALSEYLRSFVDCVSTSAL